MAAAVSSVDLCDSGTPVPSRRNHEPAPAIVAAGMGAAVADEYDSEYRYSGRPIPALQGLDRAAVVIFAGSFTDVLFPALRLAYLVVPSDMVDIFAAAESVSTHHPPLIDQAILCDFI